MQTHFGLTNKSASKKNKNAGYKQPIYLPTMGIFGKFFKKAKKAPLASVPVKKTAAVDDASIATSDTCTTGSQSTRRKKSTSAPSESRNVGIVKLMLERLNAKDCIALRSMVTKDLQCEWEEQAMRFDDWVNAVEDVWKSFPDFNLTYTSVEDGDKENVVIVHECVPSGTHTGEPFGFGPYEPIPASGTRVVNAAETITVHLTPDGEICKWLVKVEGELTGPAGMYAQLPGGFPCM